MQQGRGHYGSFEVVQQQFMVGRAPESHQRIFSVAQDHGAVLPTPALSQQQQQQQLVDQQQQQQEQNQEYHAQFQQPQTQQQQHQQQSQSNSQHFPDDHQQQVQSYQQAVGQILELGSVSPELHSPLSSRAFHTPFKQQQLVTATRDSTLADDDDNFEDGEKGSGGNRWPRQETLALIKIRTDLDSSFKDTAVKGPLWEEVSRKLGELGYHRNAKKCKEKFENVHKYYKKTKNGRAGRQDGKHYRFFSELEALFGGLQENSRGSARGLQMVAAAGSQRQQRDAVAEDLKTLFNFEDDQRLDHSKKRKRKTFSSSKRQMQSSFENVLKNLMERQEAMQKRFLEGVERRERERLVREEEWKREEIARIDRDMKLQDQERSLAATRDAALVAFLQKLTGKTVHFPPPPPPAHPHSSKSLQIVRSDQDAFDPDHRRWPKAEVLALIRLRSGMEGRFQEPGSKAALWEDIANGMSRDLGYNRNSKRCKEKWENINKYFRKTKESNRKRPENAKTCPYFHQLDTLYGTGALNPPTPAAAKPTSKPAEDPPAPDPPTGMMKMLLALSDDHDQICSQGANASSELQPCPENASDHGGQGLQKQN